jgi:hypothetical protein
VRIGLIDVDGHNFPNLPLMKLSAYHKQRGDSVSFYDPLLSDEQDVVYMSKVLHSGWERGLYPQGGGLGGILARAALYQTA